MAATTVLDQILEQIATLGPEQLHQVQEAVQDRLASSEEERKRARFHRALLASGLVREIKPGPTGAVPEQPVPVTGEPLSETIIRERR
jgi:hypothetical protein